MKLEAAKKALRFYCEGKHYDTVALEDHPVTGLKHTRLLDNGGIAEEVLRWIDEAPDASMETPVIDEQHLTVDYQVEPGQELEDMEAKLKAVAERLRDSLNDATIWFIGYTVGTVPPTLVVYREPGALLRPSIPLVFEDHPVQVCNASRPVALNQ